MDVTVIYIDGQSFHHKDAIIVGEIVETNQLVVGNEGDVNFYDFSLVASFTGTPSVGEYFKDRAMDKTLERIKQNMN